jgi:hypothetical protein
MEEVTKIKAMHTPEIMQAHFGNEERIKLVIAKHEEAEKMKADKESIDNEEEFQKAMSELLKGSDDEDTNTNNGGGSGEED